MQEQQMLQQMEVVSVAKGNVPPNQNPVVVVTLRDTSLQSSSIVLGLENAKRLAYDILHNTEGKK